MSFFNKDYLFNQTIFTNIRFTPTDPNILILHSDSIIYCVNLQKSNFTSVKKYKGILFLDFIESGEMVVVERLWREVINCFPPPLNRIRYAI